MPDIDVRTECAAYSDMEASWGLVAALLGGTKAMRAEGTEFLPQEEAESDKHYQSRLSRTTLYNGFERTVQGMTGRVFAKPILLPKDIAPEQEEWTRNVDLTGRSLQQFSRDVMEVGMAYGVCHIHVDYEKVEEPLTKADEVARGLRPYLRLIHPRSVIRWRSGIVNGVVQLTEVAIAEDYMEPVGEYGEALVKSVRILKPGLVEVWKKVKDTWVQDSVSEVSYTGSIPWATFYAKRTGFMTAAPPLQNLAELNLAHWQSSSDQRYILKIARVPILYVSGASAEELGGQAIIGASKLMAFKSEGAKMAFAEHSGLAIDAGRKDLEALEQQMAAQGLELLAPKPGSQTATEKSINKAENESTLASIAQGLEDALDTAIACMCGWVNKEAPKESFKTQADYSVLSSDQVAVTALKDARTSGDLTRSTYLGELQKRGILSEDVDIEAEDEELKNEGEELSTPPRAGGFEKPDYASMTPEELDALDPAEKMKAMADIEMKAKESK